MKPILNDYHKKINEVKLQSVESLEQAETVARGVLESIQAVAGTTDCKGVQIITHIIQMTSLTLRPTMSW